MGLILFFARTYLKISFSALVSGSTGNGELYAVNDQSRHDSSLFLGLPQYHDIPPLSSVKLHISGYVKFCSHFMWAWQNVASV